MGFLRILASPEQVRRTESKIRCDWLRRFAQTILTPGVSAANAVVDSPISKQALIGTYGPLDTPNLKQEFMSFALHHLSIALT